ncbi:unnamed protein product, partial [Arctogadus glacialis]
GSKGAVRLLLPITDVSQRVESTFPASGQSSAATSIHSVARVHPSLSLALSETTAFQTFHRRMCPMWQRRFLPGFEL